MAKLSLKTLERTVVACRLCPRLVAWREQVAREKRKAYQDEEYWGKPVPSFGADNPRLLVCGLAPAAHGGNRTGRVFTGDRSGDWLYAALFRAGFANQPQSTHRGDGLELHDCRVTACVRCAPPDNRPTPTERDTCLRYLAEELRLMKEVQVIVCLGGFAWDGVLKTLRELGHRAVPNAAFRSCRRGDGGAVRAARQLPSQPAKHLHRPAHRGDARPGLREGEGVDCRLTGYF